MARLLICTGFLIVFGIFYPRSPATNSSAPRAAVRPDYPGEPLGTRAMPHGDAVSFLEASLKKYDQTVKGYRVNLVKHEKVQGKVRLPESVEVDFVERPFSVHMRWKENPDRALAVLYLEGQNGGKMKVLVNPSILGIWDKAVDSIEAKNSTRYTVNQFGIKKGTERTLARWRECQKHGKLTVHYLGVQPVEELDGRRCHVLHRPDFPTEDDGVADVMIYLDEETELQTGSVLLGKKFADGSREVIGKYFFRNLELNPTFPGEAFTVAVLRKPWNPR